MKALESIGNSLLGAGAGLSIWHITCHGGGWGSFVAAGVLIAALLTSERV
jgi:hypothetical protein